MEVRIVTLVVAVVVAGAVGGTVAAVAVAKSLQPRAATASPAPPARDEREAAGWAELARELRRATPAAPPPAPSASVVASATPRAEAPAEELRPPDPVADRAVLDREYADDRARHDRDGRDPTWATRAETSLQHSIASIPGAQRVVRVECKTTSCIARLEWDSRELASKEYGKVLAGSFEPNCAAKILIHDQDTPGKPFQDDLILDCTNSRAEGL